MRYLLDTHAVIWLAKNSPKIPIGIKDIVIQAENSIYISSVSFWEIAIKISLGKLDLDFTLEELLYAVEGSDFGILQIENDYLKYLSKLPLLHKDPFDRLLISTALAEDLTIITADENIHKYDVAWLWQNKLPR
jgi:PIN domain nuclease of toxin-antitoxin system